MRPVVYRDHDLELRDCDVEAKIPDLTELFHSRHHGHFADHYADSHVAAEDNSNWGWTHEADSAAKPVEMPSLDAQQMHET